MRTHVIGVRVDPVGLVQVLWQLGEDGVDIVTPRCLSSKTITAEKVRGLTRAYSRPQSLAEGKLV